MKKNNVSIDVINFSHTDNVSRLQSMVAAANQGSGDSPNSHFLDVAPGCNITDVLISSPICMPEDQPGGVGGGANPMAGLGLDPNMDPELAEAIRLSLEENKAAEPAPADPAPVSAPSGGDVQPGLQAVDDDNMYEDDDEDEQQLKEALALSMPTEPKKPEEKKEEPPKPVVKDQPTTADVNIDEDFLKDVIGDLGIDVDPNAISDLMD